GGDAQLRAAGPRGGGDRGRPQVHRALPAAPPERDPPEPGIPDDWRPERPAAGGAPAEGAGRCAAALHAADQLQRRRPAGRIRVARVPGRPLLLRDERRGRLEDVSVAAEELLARLTRIRATDPDAVQKALGKRKRRPMMQRGSLFLVAADHPARGVLKAGTDP